MPEFHYYWYSYSYIIKIEVMSVKKIPAGCIYFVCICHFLSLHNLLCYSTFCTFSYAFLIQKPNTRYDGANYSMGSYGSYG